MSCAACRNAKGYSTPCPYCREPGDLQRKAMAMGDEALTIVRELRVAHAAGVERIATLERELAEARARIESQRLAEGRLRERLELWEPVVRAACARNGTWQKDVETTDATKAIPPEHRPAVKA